MSGQHIGLRGWSFKEVAGSDRDQLAALSVYSLKQSCFNEAAATNATDVITPEDSMKAHLLQ
jgi:hypothetical protein